MTCIFESIGCPKSKHIFDKLCGRARRLAAIPRVTCHRTHTKQPARDLLRGPPVCSAIPPLFRYGKHTREASSSTGHLAISSQHSMSILITGYIWEPQECHKWVMQLSVWLTSSAYIMGINCVWPPRAITVSWPPPREWCVSTKEIKCCNSIRKMLAHPSCMLF